MESKHTPGPWTTEYDGSLVMGGQVVCRAPGPDSSSYPERKANARLISCAPELLAALELCEVELHGYADYQQDANPDDWKALDAARAAIAKALGETT